MTKEEMLNLKLYECNKKRCSGFRSCDAGQCHLTSDVRFAVDPENPIGYEYFVMEQIDKHLAELRKMLLDVLMQSEYYPESAATFIEYVWIFMRDKLSGILEDKFKELEEDRKPPDQRQEKRRWMTALVALAEQKNA